MQPSKYIAATERWVDDVVINYNFCPFARFVRHPNRIHYCVEQGDAGSIIAALYDECVRLDRDTDIATTLLIIPGASTGDFNDFLDILALAEHMLSDWGYSGIYQLASFHPAYLFDAEQENSPSHFTNRSPYPILHLIRESDIAKYMKNEDDAEKIYRANMEKAASLGCEHFKAVLSSITKAE